METIYQSPVIEITINENKYLVHSHILEKYLPATDHGMKDMYTYVIDLEGAPKIVSDNIVHELYAGFKGGYINDDPDNELYYYIFVDKYINRKYIKKLKFPRRKQLARGYNILKYKTSMNEEEQELYMHYVIYTLRHVPGFRESYHTTRNTNSIRENDDNGKVTSMSYNLFDAGVLHLVRHIIKANNLDIIDIYNIHNKVTENEILYYKLP